MCSQLHWEVIVARRTALVLVTILVAACQGAGTATVAPGATATVTSPPASTVAATLAPTTAPTKPVTLPRIEDLPLDGTCEDENTSCLGALEAGKVYTTTVFEPATSFAMPNGDWVNPFETGGSFGLLSKREIGDAIVFFREARAVDKSIGATVTDIATWLETNDSFTVTPFEPATIGGLTGVSMDIRLALGATNQDEGCPVQVCVPILRGDDPVLNDPYLWHWGWSSAGTEAQRLYLLDGKDTIIAIFLDSPDGLTLDALNQTFDAMKPTIAFY